MSQSAGRDMKRWVCKTCDHIHTGQNPPMICPECEATQNKFVFRKLTKEDYAKIRRGRKRLPNRSDILILGSGIAAFVSALVCTYYGLGVIVTEETDTIGSSDLTAFSDKEKTAAFESLKQIIASDSSLDYLDMEYHQLASSMLAFLAEEDVLPEFKEAAINPFGDPHPWGSFSESRSLEVAPDQDAPSIKTDLLHRLSYWGTNNEVRMLLNHKPTALLESKDSVVVGLEFDFNGKAKPYYSDIAVFSFLDEGNDELLKNKVKAKEDAPDAIGFTAVDKVPYLKMTAKEEAFWGKGAQIGPSMTRAYKTALEIIDKFDFLEAVEK